MVKPLEALPELVYVGDPMCSWCWGFAPVLARLQQRFALPLRVLVGGLRPGPSAQALDPSLARFLSHHWEQVEARTGQSFNHDLLSWDDWTYDTELPAIAVVTMRSLNEKETLAFFARLQRAFYVENVDVTDPDSYGDLVEGFEVEPARFMRSLGSEAMKQAAWGDFEQARRLGVGGFPTLLLEDEGRWGVVSTGYAPFEALAPSLEDWLGRTYGDAGSSLVTN